MKNTHNAIVLAPHADDGEFSSGGTIKKLTSNGVKVWYVAFSPCKKSIPKGFSENILYDELLKAVSHLGIDKNNVITFNFTVREFDKHRQEILDNLITLKKEIQPDLVLLPNSKDVHQDHQVIHNEGIRAFKHFKILGYELPWNNIQFNKNLYVKLEKEHLDAKIAAIREYKSQEFRFYSSEDFFYSLARVRGTQINCEYAEAFEVIRWIL
ncbi:MAG: PIG-L family deacetylase [Bacteroidota bacterium]